MAPERASMQIPAPCPDEAGHCLNGGNVASVLSL